MKVVVPSDGKYLTSKYISQCEKAQYLIVYDVEGRFYGSRVSPAFESQDIDVLLEFLKKIFIKNIITSSKIESSYFKVFSPKNEDATVEEALLEFIDALKK